MEKSLRVVSLSHELASIDVREKFSLSAQQCDEIYQHIKELFGISEALILCTCNRVELYYFNEVSIGESLIRYICSLKGMSYRKYSEYFETADDRNALLHLFSVAVGLKSQVLGDREIYGQVKRAYQQSVNMNMSDALMNRLMHKVFNCHKNISQYTAFKCGAASISYNALQVLKTIYAEDRRPGILVIGAGQMAGDICRHLSKKEYQNVSVTNRTDAKAYELSEECNFSFIPFYRHKEDAKSFDVIISTIKSETISYQASDLVVSQVKTIIDVSSPRSVSGDVETLGIQLFDIDQLGQMVDEVMEVRQSEVPKVQNEIELAVKEFIDWQSELQYTSNITKFKKALEEVRKQTMASMMKKMSPGERDMAEEVTHRMVQKIVNLPAVQIRTACKRGNAEELSGSLMELFNVETVNNVKP